jgi:hypothetical protein
MHSRLSRPPGQKPRFLAGALRGITSIPRKSRKAIFAIQQRKGPAYAGPLIITINESNLPAVATTAAAAATAVTAEAATTAARTSAAASAGLVLGFVDAQLTATHIVTIQALNGSGCIGLAHFNEPEPAGTAGLTIGRQRHGLDSPVLREQCANVRLTGAERQIAYIDFGHKFSTLQTTRSSLRGG